MSEQRVRVVAAADLAAEGGPSSIVRRHAIADPELWAGLSTIAPGTESGWHHHGTNTTVFYMVSGRMRVDSGSDPVESATASRGDFAVVPPGVLHREIVEGPDEVEAVVIRFGDGVGPAVVEVEVSDGA